MRYRNIVFGLILVFLLCFSVGVAAGDEVQVYMDPEVTIEIDGDPFIPRDANGRILYPFIIEGNTYLPLRALCQAAGYTVDWDEDTKHIDLTPREGDATYNMTNNIPLYSSAYMKGEYRPDYEIYFEGERFYPLRDGKSIDPIVVQYSTFLPVRVVCERAGFIVDWDNDTRTVKLQSAAGQKPYVAAGQLPSVKTAWGRMDYWPIDGQPGNYRGYNYQIPQIHSELPGATFINQYIAGEYDAEIGIAKAKTSGTETGNSGYVVSYHTAVDANYGILSVVLLTAESHLMGRRIDGVQVFHYNYKEDKPVTSSVLMSITGATGAQLVNALKKTVGVYGDGGKGSGDMPAIKREWLTEIEMDYGNLNFYPTSNGFVVYYRGQYYGIETLGRAFIPRESI